MDHAPSTSASLPVVAGRVRLNADTLKAHRHRLGLSQEAFAVACFERQLCVSIASVKRAETGKPLLLRTARHLAAFYDVDLKGLLDQGGDGVGDGGHEPLDALHADSRADQVKTPLASGKPARQAAEGRLVHVLCLWPVPDAERQAIALALNADGATVLAQAPGAAPPRAMLAVFGLERAQRSDLARCATAATRWPHLHALVCGGMWQDDALDWPHEAALIWLRDQPAGSYAHRSVFGPLRNLWHIEPLGHAELGRIGAAHRRMPRPLKLAGRQHEMRLFASLLDTVLVDQQSQVMLVQGMAGMGKSRLLAEMADRAQAQFMSTVQMDIPDFGGDLHRAVCAGWLRKLLDLHEVTPFWEQLAAQRLQHFALPAEQSLVCRDLLDVRMAPDERMVLQAMSHAARAEVTVRLFTRVISRMSLQRPMLLVVEDLHWASPSTVEMLARVMAASQEAQVLWVLSSRVESPQRAQALQAQLADVAVTTLNLVPLRAQEVQALSEQFTHVADGWRSQCEQRAQGHPLFLTQLLMADRHDHLPDNFQHLLQVRLDEISLQDRQALRLAAVLGQPFTSEEMRTLLGVPDYELDTLVRQCLLRQQGGDSYDFLHALIRQGVYEGLSARQCQALHVQVAEHYRPSDAALHARHLHLARHPDAPQALLAAARQCQEVFDHEGALSLLLLLAEVDYAPRDRHAHAMALGAVQAKMGRTAQARQAYEEALGHAPDMVARLKAVVALAGVLNVLEDLAAEEALIDEALPQAIAARAYAEQAGLHYLQGNLYFPRGDVTRSRMHHSRAMDLARLAGEARLQAQALSGLGDSYYAEGLMVTANEHFARCLQLCDQHGLRDIEASNRFMLATTQIYLCQTEGALQQAEASAELGRRVGNRRAETVSLLTAGWVRLGMGQPREALSHFEDGLAISRAIGAMRFEPFLQEGQARALHALGDEVSAQRVIHAALEGVEKLKLHAFIGPWVMGTWALLHHQDADAVRMLQRAQERIAEGCVAHNVYRFHACAMEVHVLAGRREAALQMGQSWLARTGREATPWVQGLHDFMAACCGQGNLPDPAHPAWEDLRQRRILHVMLKLPRALMS